MYIPPDYPWWVNIAAWFLAALVFPILIVRWRVWPAISSIFTGVKSTKKLGGKNDI